MKVLGFLKTHRMSVLSALFVVAAALLGADLGFAMAVDPVELAPEANPSENMKEVSETNPTGRPADETLQTDEQGFKTQLQGKAATATDVRDAGLEAEDYDADVDEFQKFKFPTETLIARKCRPVKVKSYEHGHYRTGSTDLTAVYTGDPITITAGANANGYTHKDGILLIDKDAFDNAECLLEYSTVLLRKTAGYRKDEDGNQVHDGEMNLYVLDHKDNNDKIRFQVLNPPIQKASGSGDSAVPATSVTIATDTKFVVLATAGSESQMHVPSETYLPVKSMVYLQKKISTAVITDEFEDQDKKVAFGKNRVLRNMESNFKRKCARSHWAGTSARKRVDVWVPEVNGREAAYTENGVIRQIPMLYTYGAEFTYDDLLAINTLMFTNNSVSDEADVACGKKALQRLIKFANSAEKYRDISKVMVNKIGIVVRQYQDNFGTLNFYWDPQLDDLGYEEYMFAIDWTHADRPYKVNDKRTERDMSKTGEAREAKEYNLVRIDCVCLNGYNAVMIVPSNVALDAANIGGIQANFESAATIDENSDKSKKYYLTADVPELGFQAGDVAQWDKELEQWVHFEGLVAATV